MGSPGGHVQESAHAFSFLGGLFGVRHTASAFLGFAALESAAQTIVKEGAGVASDAYKRTGTGRAAAACGFCLLLLYF